MQYLKMVKWLGRYLKECKSGEPLFGEYQLFAIARLPKIQ